MYKKSNDWTYNYVPSNKTIDQAIKSTSTSITSTSGGIDNIVIRDRSTGDLYNVFIENGKIICEAQDPSVKREDRFKKLLDE